MSRRRRDIEEIKAWEHECPPSPSPSPSPSSKRHAFVLCDTHDGAYSYVRTALLARRWREVVPGSRGAGGGADLRLIWTLRDQDVGFDSLAPQTIANHFRGNASITSKQGLCCTVDDENYSWANHGAGLASSLGFGDRRRVSPRMYDLADADQRAAFEDDFLRCAATAILRCVLFPPAQPHQRDHGRPWQQVPYPTPPIVELALAVCQRWTRELPSGNGGGEGFDHAGGDGGDDGGFEIHCFEHRFERQILTAIQREALLLYSRCVGLHRCTNAHRPRRRDWWQQWHALQDALARGVKSAAARVVDESDEATSRAQHSRHGSQRPGSSSAKGRGISNDPGGYNVFSSGGMPTGPRGVIGRSKRPRSASAASRITNSTGRKGGRRIPIIQSVDEQRKAKADEQALRDAEWQRQQRAGKEAKAICALRELLIVDEMTAVTWFNRVCTKECDRKQEHGQGALRSPRSKETRTCGGDKDGGEVGTERVSLLVQRVEKTLHALARLSPQFAHIDGPRNLWVLKPHGASGGQGIEVTDDLYEALTIGDRASSGPAGRIVQKYIEAPLLLLTDHEEHREQVLHSEQQQQQRREQQELNGELTQQLPCLLPKFRRGIKFDLRWWVLVTSWAPLEASLFSHCYARLCSMHFDLARHREKLGHLSNFTLQRKNVNRSGHSSCGDNDGSLTMDGGELMWSHEQIVAFVERRGGAGYWQYHIMPKMAALVASTLRAAQPQIRDRLASQSTGQEGSAHGFDARAVEAQMHRSFELLGFDVMLDEALQPWLVEVNLSPGIAKRNTSHTRTVEAMLEGVLRQTVDRWVEGSDGRRGTASSRGQSDRSCRRAESNGGDASKHHPGKWLRIAKDDQSPAAFGFGSLKHQQQSQQHLEVCGVGIAESLKRRANQAGDDAAYYSDEVQLKVSSHDALLQIEQRLEDWQRHVITPKDRLRGARVLQRWWLRYALPRIKAGHLLRRAIAATATARWITRRARWAAREWRLERLRRSAAAILLQRRIRRHHDRRWLAALTLSCCVRQAAAMRALQRRRRQRGAVVALHRTAVKFAGRCCAAQAFTSWQRAIAAQRARVRSRWGRCAKAAVAAAVARWELRRVAAAVTVQAAWAMVRMRVRARRVAHIRAVLTRQREVIIERVGGEACFYPAPKVASTPALASPHRKGTTQKHRSTGTDRRTKAAQSRSQARVSDKEVRKMKRRPKSPATKKPTRALEFISPRVLQGDENADCVTPVSCGKGSGHPAMPVPLTYRRAVGSATAIWPADRQEKLLPFHELVKRANERKFGPPKKRRGAYAHAVPPVSPKPKPWQDKSDFSDDSNDDVEGEITSSLLDVANEILQSQYRQTSLIVGWRRS